MNRPFARSTVFVLVAVVLVVSLIGAASAQAQPTATPSSTPTNSTTTTASDGGGDGDSVAENAADKIQSALGGGGSGGNGGNGSSGGGLLGVDIPSFDPVKNLKKIFQALLNFPGWVFSQSNEMIFGVPAPGQADKPQTWLSPSNGLWSGLIDYTKVTTGLAVVMMMISGSLAFYHEGTRAQKEAWTRWLIALIMILTTWTLLPLVLHMADALSTNLRPGSQEAFSSLANKGKITAGLVGLVIAAVTQFSVLGVGIFVLIIERFLIYLCFGLWPIAWALRSTRFGFARSIGETVVFMLGVTIVTKIGQALIARLLFSLDWQGISPNTVFLVLAICAGAFFMLIYFPWKMMEHANAAASVSLGMSAAAQSAGQYGDSAKDRASERVGQVYNGYQDWRSNDNDGGSRSGENSAVGSMGSSSSSSSSSSDTDGYNNRQDSGSRKTFFGSKTQSRRQQASRRRKRRKEQVNDLNDDDEW